MMRARSKHLLRRFRHSSSTPSARRRGLRHPSLSPQHLVHPVAPVNLPDRPRAAEVLRIKVEADIMPAAVLLAIILIHHQFVNPADFVVPADPLMAATLTTPMTAMMMMAMSTNSNRFAVSRWIATSDPPAGTPSARSSTRSRSHRYRVAP